MARSWLRERFPDVASYVVQVLRLRAGINAIDPQRATPDQRIRLLHLEADEEMALGKISEITQFELDAAAGASHQSEC